MKSKIGLFIIIFSLSCLSLFIVENPKPKIKPKSIKKDLLVQGIELYRDNVIEVLGKKDISLIDSLTILDVKQISDTVSKNLQLELKFY